MRTWFEWIILTAFILIIIACVGSFIGINIWYLIDGAPKAPIEGAHGFQAAGIAQFGQGNNEKAIEYFEKSIRSNASGHARRDRWKAYYMLGETYFRMGDDEKAVYNLKRAAIYFPRDAYIYNRIARVMIKKGEYVNAENVIKVAVALQPNEGEHLNVFVWLLKRRGAV
jgi:tetratricopeptide (TPR) repeat protein